MPLPTTDSRKLQDLVPEFRKLAEKLIQNCAARGVIMRPFFTLRGPAVQGKLWCQSRSAEQIRVEIQNLKSQKAKYLASFLNPKFGSMGRWASNAIPGLSWHQWGEAIDCYVEGPNQEAIWTPSHSGYKIYAEEAVKLGLEAGALWRSRDAVHVQLRKDASPLKTGLTLVQIDAEMAKRFPAT
jgi:hypothetical protein